MKKFNKILLLVTLLMVVTSCSNSANIKVDNQNVNDNIKMIFKEKKYIELNNVRSLVNDDLNENEIDSYIIDEIFDSFLSAESIKEPVVKYSTNDYILIRKNDLKKFNEEFLIFNLDMYTKNSEYIKNKFSDILEQHDDLEKSNIYLLAHMLNFSNSQLIDSDMSTKMKDNYNKIVNIINADLLKFSKEEIIKYFNILLSFQHYYPMPNVNEYTYLLSGLYNLTVDQSYSLDFIYRFDLERAFGVPILKNKDDLKKLPGFKEYFEMEGIWKGTNRYNSKKLIIKDFKGNYEYKISYDGLKEIYYRNGELYIEDLFDKNSNKLYKLELIGNELRHRSDTYQR